MSGTTLQDITKDLYEVFLELDDEPNENAPSTILDRKVHILDDPDFDVDAYVMSKFPTDASLADIPDAITALDQEIQLINDEVLKILHSQMEKEKHAEKLVTEIRETMTNLEGSINCLQKRTTEEDERALEVADQAKTLYWAKNNVSAVLKAIQLVSVLVDATDKLRDAVETINFTEAAALIRAVRDLKSSHNLKILPNIDALIDQSEFHISEMKNLVLEEFDSLFDATSVGKILPACHVADAIGADLRIMITKTFISTLMKNYLEVFGPGCDYYSMDFVKRRIAWLKKALLELETNYIGSHFPENWNLRYHLALNWCETTKMHISELLEESAFDMAPQLFADTLRHITDSERNIIKIFETGLIESDDDLQANIFSGMISDLFNQYLGAWLASEETTLRSAIKTHEKNSNIYRNPSAANTDEAESVFDATYSEPLMTYEFAPDVFSIIQGALEKTSTINNRYPFLKYSRMLQSLFLKHLQHIDAILLKADDDNLVTSQLELLAVIVGTLDFYSQLVADWEEEMTEMIDETFKNEINLDNVTEELWRIRSDAVKRTISILTRPILNTVGTAINELGKSNDSKDGLRNSAPFKEQMHQMLSTTIRYFNHALASYFYEGILNETHNIFITTSKRHVKQFGVTPSDHLYIKSTYQKILNILRHIGENELRLPSETFPSLIDGKLQEIAKIFK